MNQADLNFIEGFVGRCAELGVDPEALAIKQAAKEEDEKKGKKGIVHGARAGARVGAGLVGGLGGLFGAAGGAGAGYAVRGNKTKKIVNAILGALGGGAVGAIAGAGAGGLAGAGQGAIMGGGEVSRSVPRAMGTGALLGGLVTVPSALWAAANGKDLQALQTLAVGTGGGALLGGVAKSRQT